MCDCNDYPDCACGRIAREKRKATDEAWRMLMDTVIAALAKPKEET